MCYHRGNAQIYPSFNKYWEPITIAIQMDNHYEAYDLIMRALEYKQETDTLHYLAGISAWKQNAFSRAESHFKTLLSSDFELRHPDMSFMLGEIMFSSGRYAEASNNYKAYLTTLDENTTEYNFIKGRIEQTAWAKQNQSIKDPLIKISRIDNGMNTSESETSPFEMNNSIYYTAERKINPQKKSKNTDYISRIIKVNNNKEDSLIYEEGLLDVDKSIANPSFSKDQTRFLYSVLLPIENSTKRKSQIYYKVKTNGHWSKGKSLPEQVNNFNYSSTQACLVEENEEGIYRIYYSSNRPGGKGGFDIWTVFLNEDGSCSIPENLDYINTSGDEYSPFYSAKSKSLYFSSNNHLGFGGFDIYKYSWKGKDSLKVVNLGKSVNSSFDEVTYFTQVGESVAYLASNRSGSTYLDEELQACCYDIYKINSTPKSVDLIVRIRDAFDSLDLQGARISLIDITEGDTMLQTADLMDRAKFTYRLIEGRKYKIVASKLSYYGDSTLISTIDLNNFDPIKKDLFLTQEKDLNVSTYERTTNFSLKGATVQLWDFDKNVLINQFSNKDSNQYSFRLLRGKNYRLIATKYKYESDTVDISALQTANENPVIRKMFLELSAIAELRRLLPIRLFFDNDIPNPRSELDTTEILFSKIYNDYVAKKGVYMHQFADILKGDTKLKAISEIDTFFDRNVKFNGDKFLIFLDKLSIIMEEGHSIDIFLKGYASPRAKSDYNQHLSSRRVTSIRNEFDYYRDGVFHPYIIGANLKIKEIPFGESQASSDVSDSLEDTRNSIYSLKAAFERRVEILEILKGVDDDTTK